MRCLLSIVLYIFIYKEFHVVTENRKNTSQKKKKMQGNGKRTVRSKNIRIDKNKYVDKKSKRLKNSYPNKGNTVKKNIAAYKNANTKKKRAVKTGTVPKRSAAPVNNGYRQKQKKHRFKKFCLAGLAAALLCSAAGFLLWYLSFENLSLENYVAVTYSGYNTEGTARVSLQEPREYKSFLKTVEVRLLSQNGNLKNGDVLDIRFIYDEEAAKANKFRIESDDCLVEVEGLPEGRQLTAEDLFRDIHISYEGIAPKLSVSVSNNSTDPFLQTISYRIPEQKTYYDVQDTFTVEAVFSEEDAIVNEYIVPSSEEDCRKEFQIDGADRYLRDTSRISQEQIDTLNEKAASLFGDASEYGLRIFSEANLMPIWVNGKTTFVWSNPRLISVYLNKLKPEYFETEQSHNNDIKLVYMATLSQADGVACDAEVVVQFTDLIEKADGTFDLALDSGRIIAASYRNSHIRDLVNDTYAREYEAEKLDL